jgi:hypothetical protein
MSESLLKWNNKAKYEALVAKLRLTKKIIGMEALHILYDFFLMCQVREDYLTRGQRLAPYLNCILEILANF